MIRPIHFGAALTLFVLAVGRIWGGQPLREEGERREKLNVNLKATLAAEATAAGKAAAEGAKPLSQNAYKVKLVEVAVKRAILTAAGQKKYWET